MDDEIEVVAEAVDVEAAAVVEETLPPRGRGGDGAG